MPVPPLQVIPALMTLTAFLLVVLVAVFAVVCRRRARRDLDAAARLRREAAAERDQHRGWLPVHPALIRNGRKVYPLKWVRVVAVMPPEAGDLHHTDDIALSNPLPRGVEVTVIPHHDVRALFEVIP